MSKQEFNNILLKINNIWLTKYIHIIADNTNSVYSLAKDINELDFVSDIILNKGIQKNFKDFDGDQSFLLEFGILIKVNNIKINGKIQLIPNNEYGYHMVLLLNNNNSMLYEAYDNFNIQAFINKLKQCKTFDNIKQLFKKYAKPLTIGILLSIVLCNYNLSDKQIKELTSINSENIENVQQSETYDLSDYAQWDLLCSDSEITVYHAKKEQCNDDIQHTASMFSLNLQDPESHRIVAMERTMMKQYGLHYGDLIKIEGTGSRDGVYQIQDTMNKRFKGLHKIDILINNDSNIGKWNNIKVYKLSNPEECYSSFKENMADALNQTQINRRQSFQYQ